MRFELVSATERLSEPRCGEFSRMADNKRSNRTENAGGSEDFLSEGSGVLIHAASILFSDSFAHSKTSVNFYLKVYVFSSDFWYFFNIHLKDIPLYSFEH